MDFEINREQKNEQVSYWFHIVREFLFELSKMWNTIADISN